MIAGVLQYDAEGDIVFESINNDEGSFLYEEIFTRRLYLKHGITFDGVCTVVDVGANIGMFALWMMLHAPLVSEIVAIEPCQPACEVFHRNVKHALQQTCRSKSINVRLLNCAVGLPIIEGEGSTFVYYPDNPGESTRFPKEREEQRKILAVAFSNRTDLPDLPPLTDERPSITCTTAVQSLAHVFDDMGLQHIDLLKIDCEGSELLALQGIGAYWPTIRQLVVEVHDVDDRLHLCDQLIRSHGFITCTEPQLTEISDNGYVSFVPSELKLFLIYAVRPSTTVPPPPSSSV